jgi:predicted phosphoribosyltransferase
MKFLTQLIAASSLLFGLLAMPASASSPTAEAQPAGTALPKACYGAKIPAPPLRSQTLVLVDRTAFKDPMAWRDFQSSVAALMQQSAQRVVLLPFAGIAAGQVLARAMDVVIEPALPEQAREEYVIRDFKSSQACVKRRQATLAQHMDRLLQSLQAEEGRPLERSEILYTAARSLQEFHSARLPTRVLVYSDGLQNGSGMTFYRAGQPRDINPAQELVKLRSMNGSSTSTPHQAKSGDVRVLWWGLLSGPVPAKPDAKGVHYLNAQILAHYSEFWRSALREFGASRVDIGPTLNNPQL